MMKKKEEEMMCFIYDNDEYYFNFERNSEALILQIKKTFESLIWKGVLSKKEIETSDWKILGNYDRMENFIQYSFQNKNYRLTMRDDLKINFEFYLDMQFTKIHLQLLAEPGDFDSKRVLDMMMKEQKNIRLKLNELQLLMPCPPSKIMTKAETETVKSWISPDPASCKLNLLYRASYDGFLSATFHKKCDGRNPTVTIVETLGGTKFGGFASIAWHSNGTYSDDSEAFIFSLTHNIKIPYNKNGNAIYGNAGYGPTFGSGHDLYICNSAVHTASSYVNPATSYPIPKDSEVAGCFPAIQYFLVKEVEVYLVGKQSLSIFTQSENIL